MNSPNMDFSLQLPTRFAPADRETSERIREEHEMIAAAEVIGPTLDSVCEPMAVTNEHRQIVHSNRAFLDFVRCSAVDELLGLRLGEVLGCVHATEDLSGCGTHPSCKICGTVNATLSALDGQACVAEVNLCIECSGRERALDFDLNASPLPIRGRLFALLKIEPFKS